MGTTVDHEPLRWLAHAKVDKFTAADERDAMHVFFPKRARIVDEADKRGQLHRLPKFMVPHMELAHYRELGIDPYRVTESPGNLLTSAGIVRMWSLATGQGGTAWAHATCRIIVGDGGGSVPTPAYADTNLAATTNWWGQIADTGNPQAPSATGSGGQVVITATVGTANANFEWREWGIDQGTASASGSGSITATLLNHKGVDLGLKTSSASWAFTVTLSLG